MKPAGVAREQTDTLNTREFQALQVSGDTSLIVFVKLLHTAQAHDSGADRRINTFWQASSLLPSDRE